MIENVVMVLIQPCIRENSDFRDIMLCSPLKVNRRFGGTCRLDSSGLRSKPSKKPALSSQQVKHTYSYYIVLYPRK
jgi:hypothetical protein